LSLVSRVGQAHIGRSLRRCCAARIMSEDETKTFAGGSLLEQILRKLEVMDTRLQFVERKIEERGFDTKPIWEKALVEIMEVNRRVTTIDKKIDVFSRIC
jgi:hypothetical protein